MSIYVFRYAPFPEERCCPDLEKSVLETASELERTTAYQRYAELKNAPGITDCLTSIQYILRRALINMAITYIGDLPRRLLSSDRWRVLKIEVKDAKCSDVIFTKKIGKQRLISHAALFVGEDKIFHCCMSLGKAAIESSDQFFSVYEQTLDFKEMIRYIDHRNRLRDIHGTFIEDYTMPRPKKNFARQILFLRMDGRSY